jgi:large subunit ribosomal protein L24
MHIRKNDIVVVMAGDDKGKKGKILMAHPSNNRVIVEGVNYIWKHVRRTQKTPAGGRVQREAALNASNVLLYCPRCNRGVRAFFRKGDKGKKLRVCKICKEAI